MSENPTPETNNQPAPRRVVGKPFAKGLSGNPAGRPKIEPRVRRYARRYDRRMCRTLAELAQDPKVPPSERRRAAMDLIAVGSGRPALVQEIAGRNGGPVGPLVAVNFSQQQPGGSLDPAWAYKAMCEGTIDLDPSAFGPALDAPTSESAP